MVTTYIYDWFRKNGINELFVYKNHPLYKNIVQYLNNPKHSDQIKFNFIDNIRQVKSGCILIPPINGKTVYVECRFDNFYPDPYLTELYLSNKLARFTVASFPSMATSQIWNMEEEICAYRDLILGQVSTKDRQKGYVWILDAEKLQREWKSQGQ